MQQHNNNYFKLVDPTKYGSEGIICLVFFRDTKDSESTIEQAWQRLRHIKTFWTAGRDPWLVPRSVVAHRPQKIGQWSRECQVLFS